MTTRPIYNSALKGREWLGRDHLTEIDFAESERGMVFAHNICEPLPEAMAALIESRAECLYSEVPWPAARDTFYRRAGVTPRPHGEYQAAVKAILDRFNKPAFIVAAKRDAMALADEVHPIILYGDPGWLAISRGRAPEYRTNQDLVAQLAKAYRSVYDFSCGCGVALRPFAYFIGSDIDRKCLAYVQRELLGSGSPAGARQAV
jgi:hypothetical protein